LTNRSDDRCPCGSGEPRRLCCGVAQQPARQSANARLPEIDDRARMALWSAFLTAASAERQAIARRAIREDAALDAELAFDMIAVIRDDDRAAFAALADALSAERADLFNEHAIYYLDWLIEEALLSGADETLPLLCAHLAAAAAQDFELFTITIDRLAYFGHLDLLASLTADALPHIRAADMPDWQLDAYIDRAAELALLAAWRSRPDPQEDPARLHTALAPFGAAAATRFAPQIPALLGSAAPLRSADRTPDQLSNLAFAFIGDSWRAEQIAPARANLARAAMLDYLAARQNGSLRRISARPRRALRGAHTNLAAKPAHPLCPDRVTLELFLATLLDLPSPHYYTAAALLELTPAWLRFLMRTGVIDSEQYAAAIRDLHPIAADSAAIWGENSSGISVAPNIRLAWEEALARL
jgi:hypothetical protein